MTSLDPVRPLEDDYGPLLTEHVKTILESGLLLDEEYEVLLDLSCFKVYPARSAKLPVYELISAGFGLLSLGALMSLKNYGRLVVALPSLAVSALLLYKTRSKLLKENKHKNIVCNVVKSFNKLRKLNVSIIRYFKMRKECISVKRKDAVILTYYENIKDFIAQFSILNKNYFKMCIKQLEFLASLVEELSEDYASVKEINLEYILTADDVDTDQLAIRIQDVHTFLTSKYLNYLGITFCKITRNPNVGNLEVLLDETLPYINTSLKQLCLAVQKEFNNLRYCTSKKLEIDVKNRNSLPRQLSGKLQQTLIGAVNSLSIIMEKSRGIMEKVGDIEEVEDVTKIERGLVDLRDHAFATYESLDILCKLYGVLSNVNKIQEGNNLQTFSKETDISDTNAVSVNYDDNSEVLEENYELFIPESEEINVAESTRHSEDETGVYLNLMLRELRQTLKQHERFIAARSKRGITDEQEEGDYIDKTNKKDVPIPKFDLKIFDLKSDRETSPAGTENKPKLPLPAPRLSKDIAPPPPPLPVLSPPPPPPLLPQFRAVDINEHKRSESKRTLFDGIRTLSSQLQCVEDVFGDGCSDSD